MRERGNPGRGWADGLRPETRLLVSAWADKHRLLPTKSSGEPGPWRTSRTPYLREPMDCMSRSSPIEEVVLMWAAQLGKTEAILNALGYAIDNAPGPIMLVQPTVDTAKRFSTQRLTPMVEANPRIAAKMGDQKSRSTRTSMLMKDFMGGVLVMTGANSAVGLRSMPVRDLFLDEIDGYPLDLEGEGDPIGLAEARQRTFARRKRMKTSTPTIQGASAIERAWEATDRRRYFVPCPHCGTYQPLEFGQLAWSKLGLEPADAVYLCISEDCKKPIEHRHKTAMLASGEWRPTAESRDHKVRGYHLNGLYAPAGWVSWGDIAKAFVASKDHPTELKRFTNTVLAETWVEKGDAPEWKRIYESRREAYEVGTVPLGGLFLTAGVDVQKDRLVVEVVAWGRGKESWSVMFGEIPGSTSDLTNGPWSQLDALLARTFTHEAGSEMTILKLAVDSGYNSSEVYTWARGHAASNRVHAVKGQPMGGALIGASSSVEANIRGRAPLRGCRLWPVTGSVAKSELYGWLSLERPDGWQPGDALPAGWCHFPEDYDEDFFKQLTAEQLVSKRNRKGFMVTDWTLIPGRENHALDARVYARAAAALAQMDRFGEADWLSLERRLGTQPSPRPEPPRESWLNRGRR